MRAWFLQHVARIAWYGMQDLRLTTVFAHHTAQQLGFDDGALRETFYVLVDRYRYLDRAGRLGSSTARGRERAETSRVCLDRCELVGRRSEKLQWRAFQAR